MTQFVLYGGKGGVGKSTLAAATGVLAARAGQKTLVVSTDPAHSLSDAYDTLIGETPTQIGDEQHLAAIEIDPRVRFRDRYGDDFNQLLEEVQSFGVEINDQDVAAISERGLVPGADEVAVLDLFAEYADHPEYDVVVFDTAPTGHTLRLLSLPDVMNATVGRILSLRSRLSSAADRIGSLLGKTTSSSKYRDRVDRLEDVTEAVGERLRDEERTEFRAVTIAEPMAIAETDRLLDSLAEDNIPVDCVIINRVLENASPDCQTCWPRYQDQQEQIEKARSEFQLPIYQIPLRSDTHGIDRIDAVADALSEQLEQPF